MSFNTGETIGPYRMMEQLGQGGMATVYKAYHASLDRYVAIKVLHQAFLEDPNFLARFQREARLVARLEHPNIVPIYDYAEHGGRPYLVMKYIEGDTLKARLHAGPISREDVSFIIQQVGAGLAYAHKQGILHRDIKPSNVILAKDGGVYLADFGLARIAQSGDSTLTSDMILGTPQYISPEQALGKSDLDQGTDIYSFGVMVYEMTTGRVPFSADTPFSVIHDHIYSPLPLPTSVNPGLSMDVERVLLKALAKDREDRYADVPVFVSDFLSAWQETWSGALPSTAVANPVEALPAASTAIASPAPETGGIVIETTFRQEADSSPAEPGQPAKRRISRKWLWVGLPIFLCLCCLGIGMLNDSEIWGAPPVSEAGVVDTPALPQNPLVEDVDSIPLEILPLEQAARAVEAEPESAILHVQLGLALIEAGQEVDGYAEIQLASELAKSDVPLLLGMAKTLERQERWPGALSMYLRVFEARPRLSMLSDNLRRAAYFTAGHPLAPDLIDPDAVQKADKPTLLMAQARHLVVHQGKFTEARELLGQIRKDLAAFPEAGLVEAEALFLEGKSEEARALLNSILERGALPAWVHRQAETLLNQYR